MAASGFEHYYNPAVTSLSSQRPVVVVLVLVLILTPTITIDRVTAADSAKDGGEVDECAQQLVGMATCLPYVGGEAKAPTPDCCSGLKQVLNKNKKCLCVIIQDRNDPDLGLQINVTLALGLPSVCHAPANVSKCPELLHLDPKSPEAQVFYQLQRNSSQTANSPAPTPSGTTVEGPVTGTSAGSSSSSCAARENDGLFLWKEMAPVGDWSCPWGFTIVLFMVLHMFI